MDLLTTYTHDSELQVITAPPPISTIRISPQHPLSLFQPAVSSLAIPWQRLLTVEILQLHVLRFCLHSLLCRTHPTTQLCPLLITSRHGPHRKHRSSIVAFMSIATGTYLPSCCLETAVVRTTENTILLLLQALPTNGHCLQSLLSSRSVCHSMMDCSNWWTVEGTNSGSCPVMSFGFSIVEPSSSEFVS
jgi:hypothetical protein